MVNLLELHQINSTGGYLVWTLTYCGFGVRTKWFNFDKYNFIFFGFAFSFSPQNAEYYHKNPKIAPKWYEKPILKITQNK